ncbi:MAG: hypothetical protein A3D65_00470 [Candidatus Lloydbacteria bacterium RIFCSPHIGHO2_02_FULL_50_13]|uniref:HTH arsR-type domain-containing protein n=1 Tax=Candidatus Lloydbacteria bacterium RIFCSPHIGHO2_02_FULL_50_13 TaxID=1798661 RepID=A0A1G2DAC4_9BACT|nr:MAG: hypothetical protein A3D65_00470 [Candidatus Lloydbacteria bacterium RIFCSPHIGHO2_02_FULL_50_13]
MLELSYKRFFTTLGNENRLLIVQYLALRGPKNVTQIAAGTKLEQTAVSHSLKRLLSCQFIHLQQNGRERIYSINKSTIKPLLRLLNTHVNTFCKKVCHKCEDKKLIEINN